MVYGEFQGVDRYPAAISIVAKNLAEKLMWIDREIKEYESCKAGMSGKRKKWKGK